jgi:hypothetical protein
MRTEEILGRKIAIAEGELENGDFLGAISDGVLYAGMGITLNFGWGWDLSGYCFSQRHPMV